MRRSLRAALWLLSYYVLIFAPLILLFVMPRPAGREFWREFAVALGFLGLSLLGLQLVPTARLRFLDNVFPVDVIYTFHHQISILSTVLILAHPLILFLNNPFTLRLLDPTVSPPYMLAAVLALLLAILLIVSSVWRQPLHLKYEFWRGAHNVLTLGVLVLALYHAFGVNYYLGVPAMRGLWIALIALWALLYAYIRIVTPLATLRRPWTVAEVRPEGGATWTLALTPVGHPGLTFEPGQFAWLTINHSPFGLHENPFSFASSAEQRDRLEFGIKELGDSTSQTGGIRSGTRVYVDAPYGSFTSGCECDPGYVFIAGGIGITPILSMLRTMADRNDRRPAVLFCGNPTWESISYREGLERLEERLNLQVVHVLENPPAGWQAETGLITADILVRHLPQERPGWRYFVCGPLPMIDAIYRSLKGLGVSPRQVRAEYYEMA
jgi:predicted ferric reductase